MSVLDIILLPDERLHQKSELVTTFDANLKKLASDMTDTMHAANGIGLAGVQVAAMKQILVIDISGMSEDENETSVESRQAQSRTRTKDAAEIYINPVITAASGEIEYEEGCLSIPGVYGKVKRASRIAVKYQDLDGKNQSLEAEGLKAIVLQHEIDHLNGVIFFDRVGPMQKMMLEKKYKKRQAQRDEEDDT